MKLSIIIPAYNEQSRIGRTLSQYLRFYDEIYRDNFELIVVLNGCRDNTLDVVKDFTLKYPQLKFVDIKEAIGKGGAVIEGFKLAQGDLIGFTDADNATIAPEFYKLIKNIIIR